MNYEEAKNYLLSIPKFAGKNDLNNLKGLLEELGNPHKKGKTIHVAGTNGKGSVCAFLSSILKQSGYRVGVFTSPHLVKVNERFRIQDTMIDDGTFLQVFQQVMESVQTGIQKGYQHPSFFEYMFLMAACWFAKQQPDYIIYETGLGGRLDATNVLEPSLTILTSIGMDHMEYLGDSLEQIAGEKAGILKLNTPCIYLKQQDVSSHVIEKRGQELGIPLIPVENNKITIDEIGEEYIDFSYVNQYDNTYRLTESPDTYRIRKTALYQMENAALAIEAGYFLLTKSCLEKQIQLEAESLLLKKACLVQQMQKNIGQVEMEQIAVQVHQGIYQMQWPGRMEELEPGIFVDGAHNEPAIRSFCDTLTRIYRDKKIILLFAVAKDKRYNEMIRILCEAVSYERIIVTAIEGERVTPVEQVAELFHQYTDCLIETEETISKALALAHNYLTMNSRVFCVGSLYLVGHLKAEKEE